jgi:hypothetical protein
MPGEQLAVAGDIAGHRLPRGLIVGGSQRLQYGLVVAGGGRWPAADGRIERPGGVADRGLDEPVDCWRICDPVDRQVKLRVELFDDSEDELSEPDPFVSDMDISLGSASRASWASRLVLHMTDMIQNTSMLMQRPRLQAAFTVESG